MWHWEMLHPHQENEPETVPCARDIWGGMLAYDACLYVFGGLHTKYGPAQAPGDLSTVGTLNDLWRYDVTRGAWDMLEADDGTSGFSDSADRPCGRVLPAWVPVQDRFYLFGGLCNLSAGFRNCLLNDLWSYDPATGRWALLEPDDGRVLETPTRVDGCRPTALGAMGAVCLGTHIYLLAGWGQTPYVVNSSQLWRYDVGSGSWEYLGCGSEGRADWPSKRMCHACTAWKGKLYLWGGRDDAPGTASVFYNDLWEYGPEAGAWTCIQEHRAEDSTRPSPRYGTGDARIGHDWYVFGGFGSVDKHGPQLNDLWRCDLRTGTWRCLEPHDGAKDYTSGATRPGVRRVPGMAALGTSVYLFAGLDLASGAGEDGPTVGFNDLWRGSASDEGVVNRR